jgi:hypothetical protein
MPPPITSVVAAPAGVGRVADRSGPRRVILPSRLGSAGSGRLDGAGGG